tara:strand:- start:123 stop:308 length:186 start_codon:yes stop_codon:yes gene_type:complete
MTRPTTEELKSSLEQLVKTYNEAVKTQQNCKEAIIATQAVLKDRELEDGDSNTVTSEIAED